MYHGIGLVREYITSYCTPPNKVVQPGLPYIQEIPISLVALGL